jgi:NADH-quinone oxidoreductase subunit M
MGLPGLGNFIGEFLILLGTFRQSIAFASVAAVGVVFSAVYALWMMQRVFQGATASDRRLSDLTGRETVAFAIVAAAIMWIGLYPRPIIAASAPAVSSLQTAVKMQAPESSIRSRDYPEGIDDAP